jgi:Uma2 family endonuclease
MATVITDISQLDPNGTYTYADYLTWRFDEMVELIKGKIYKMSPAPLRRHQMISQKIDYALLSFLDNCGCHIYTAPFDVRLKNSDKRKEETGKNYMVVQPDICVICDETKLDDYGCNGSPDWIVEITSPSTIKKDFNEKYNAYQESGVKEYWIVVPEQNLIHTYFLDGEEYKLTGIYDKTGTVASALFPDFSVTMETIFK